MTSLLESLRSAPHERALSDESVVRRLLGRLESWLDSTGEPLTLRAPRELAHGPASALGRLRGVAVHQMVRLAAAGYDWDNPARDALSTWRAESEGELTVELGRLDAEERAALLAELDAHAVVLRRSLGPIAPGWMPRAGQRVRVVLGGGRLVLADVVDLMLGVVGEHASVALIDVTSAPLGPGAEARLAYHALCQTLRTSHVPLASAVLSSATGEVIHRYVDEALLDEALSQLRLRVEEPA